MRESYGLIAAFCAFCSISAAAQPLEVTITRADCSQLVRHLPDADVSADYQPGVDARGKPVAPADLYGANPIELPETFTFLIEVNPLSTSERRTLESERRILAARVAAAPDNADLRAQLDALDAEAARLDGRPESATTLAVGEVTVNRDGRVTFNGQPLQNDKAWELSERCREILAAPTQ
ncbi:hypothetical protein [Algihabitans albus]|uniref:hypothetical protein n=1 Tax=Algihabitans albus TaxID=2164067 RepID=UPI000E5CF21D|nr:hypothetical protein [Algihabitans albus]